MAYYPLNNTFAAIGTVGLCFFVFLTYSGRISLTWGTTFIIFFTIMFVSALVTLKPTMAELQ